MDESKNNPSLMASRPTWAPIREFLMFQLAQEVERNLREEDQVFTVDDLDTVQSFVSVIGHMLGLPHLSVAILGTGGTYRAAFQATAGEPPEEGETR